MREHRLISLDKVSPGRHTFIRRLCGGIDFIRRMTVLGFIDGAEIQVIQNYGRGPLIAKVRGARVALGRGEALKVLVEDLDHGSESRPQSFP